MKKLLLTAVLSTSMIVAQSYPFVGGESLSYEVSLNILSAGNAILKINDLPEPSGTPLYLITFHMRTNSLWDQIFPIRDTVESWVDKKALITRKLKKAIHERKNKPIFLATGACEMKDVERAVAAIKKYHNKIVLMQCNTNYTANKENTQFWSGRPSLILGLPLYLLREIFDPGIN